MLSNVPTTLVLGQVWRSIRSLRRSCQDEILLGSLQPCLTRCPPDLVAIRKAGPRQERTDVAIAVHHGVLKEPTFLQDFLAGMEHERGSDAESGMRPSGTHRSFDALTKQPFSPKNSQFTPSIHPHNFLKTQNRLGLRWKGTREYEKENQSGIAGG